MKSKTPKFHFISTLALFVTLAGSAQADNLWTLQPISNGHPLTDGPYTIGNNFTVGPQPLTVTQLGAMDSLNVSPWYGSNGFIGGATCDVGIWDSAGTLLGSVTVASADPISGNYRYHALTTPVTLAAGASYTIGALCASGHEYRMDVLPGGTSAMGSPDAAITVTGARFFQGATLTRPTNSAGDGANSLSSLRWLQANAVFSVGSTVTSTAYWDSNGNTTGIGGTNTWDTSSSFWTADATGSTGSTTYSNASGIQAAFGGTAGTVTVASGTAITVDTLRFDTSGYTIAGADGTATLSNPVLTVITGTGNSAAVNAVISGSTSLTKNNDSGNLTLGGVNTYTGNTTIKGGTLTLGGAGQLGSGTYAGTLVNNGAFVYNSSAAQTLSGTVTGSGTLTQSGSGQLTLSGAGKFLSGATFVNAGTLVLSNVGNTFNSSTTVAPGATLELHSTNTAVDSMMPGGNVSAIQITGTGTINKTGVGWVQGCVDTFKNFNGTLNINAGTFGSGFATGLIGTTGSTMVVNMAAGTWFDLRGAGVNAAKIDKLTGTGFVGTTHNVASTLTVGTANGSSTFDGIIKGAGGGAATTTLDAAVVSLVKEGTGTFTLTGANTYKGTTTVNGGSLVLTGAATLANPTVSVAGGARIDVSGLSSPISLQSGNIFTAGRTSAFAEDVKGNLTNAGGTIHIAGTGATAGTLTQTGNLKLDSGSVKFDLGTASTTGAGVNDLITVSGDLDLTGTTGLTNITINKLGTTLAPGNYTLITCGGSLTGSAANLNLVGLTDTARQTFTLSTTANSVVLVVTGVPANLVWTGADATNPTFWDADATANWSGIANGKFLDGDNVLFDDTASSTTVEPQNFVQPSSVIFNNSIAKPYTITGTSGGIDGSTGLVKNGNGPLTITTDNAFTGTTTITAGSLTLSDVGLLGSGTYAANIANDGALIYSSTPNQTFSGVLSGTGTLTMSGIGKLYLPSVNTYSGSTTLSAGTLEIGPAAGGTGTYLGTGTVVLNGGTLSTPGSTVANTVIQNSVVVNAATTNTLDAPGPNINLLGNITGSGNLIKPTTGHAVFLGGDNSGFTGAVSANNIQFSSTTAGSAAAAWTSTGNIGLLSNLTASGTIHLGSLSGGSGSLLATQGATGTTTYSIGALNTDTTFEGIIKNAYSAGAGNVAITKTGTGTLTLAGANTYTGITTVNGGTLNVTGSLRLKPTTNGVVNTTGGTATLVLDGALDLDLSTANTTAGNSWLLVDVANLSESYGDNFGLKSGASNFTETSSGSGVWKLTSGANAWTFTESTGTLTVAAAAGYQSWMAAAVSAGFTGDTAAGADPDNDGMKNLMEYVLNGNPGASSLAILPQQQVTATNFVFTFTRRVDSASDTTQVFEYGSNLSGWTPVNITGTPGAEVSIGTATGTAPNEEQTVTVTIPRTAAVNGKLFGRLHVTQP